MNRECWVVEFWCVDHWQVYEPCLLKQYAEGLKADMEENPTAYEESPTPHVKPVTIRARVVRYVPEEE